jgi:transposase
MVDESSSRVELLARKARWSEDEAKLLLEAALSQGNVNAFEARHNVNASRLYQWRRKLQGKEDIGTVGFREMYASEGGHDGGKVEIVLPSGYVVRVSGTFSEEALRRTLEILEGGQWE